tara:strand:+ start:7825 stop:8970 length:1146 start_codon:yes stop_codon:yes gene_type:complete
MAVYKIFPTKDNTIYSRYPARNTGLDSIIEASAEAAIDTDALYSNVSRYLIKFSQDEIEDLFDNTITGSYEVYLRNYIADIKNLNTDTTLEVHPISGSWDMGTGRFNDTPETDNGSSWSFMSYSGSRPWATTTFGANATASFSSQSGGGTWYTGSNIAGLKITSNQIYSYNSNKDLNVDVTGVLKAWVSHSVSPLNGFYNDGFIIKLNDSDEFINSRYEQPKISFYSVDTNTIYPPNLEFKWDDYSLNTGSSNIPFLYSNQMVAALDNNPGEFRRAEIHRFNVNCRPDFPRRVFQTASLYVTPYYLPTSSYYAVKDLSTNEYVIDFDSTYTKISTDATSSFFNLHMNGFEPERYYEIILKTEIGKEVSILEDNYYFKIING